MFSSKYYKRLLALSLTIAVTHQAFALGIDKLTLAIDRSADFSAISHVVLFNDSDEISYVTGRSLAWSNDETGKMVTSPTTDLTLSPPVVRIPAKGSATFAVRYSGPKMQGEGAYRAVFKETRMSASTTADDSTGPVQSQIMTGLVMTIPVFVSNFADKAIPFNGVKASFHRTGDTISVVVENSGDLHVIVESVRFAGEEAKRLHNTVFSHKTTTFDGIKAPEAMQDVKLDLSYGTETQHIVVTEVK